MKFSIDEGIKEIPYYPKAALYGADERWVRLSSNENPFPPSNKVVAGLLDAVFDVNRYPESETELKGLIAARHGIKPENVVIGNGSNEIIETSLKAMRHATRGSVVIPEPSFAFYGIAAQIYGFKPVRIDLPTLSLDLDLIAQRIDDTTRVVFLNNPNNPTGMIFEDSQFRRFLKKLPADVLVVVDEAYAEFATSPKFPRSVAYINDYPIVVLRTFSKAFALAGLRIGYGMGEASLVSYLERTKQPFSVNMMALIAARAALGDEEHLAKVLDNNREGKAYLYRACEELGLSYVPTEANYVLVQVGKEAEAVTKGLFGDRILVRWMGAYGLPDYVRFTIGTSKENQRLIEGLEGILGGKKKVHRHH